MNIRIEDVPTMTNQWVGLNAQWLRIYLEMDDPGTDAIYFDDAAFDNLWSQSPRIQNRITRFVYDTFASRGSKFIFTPRTAPRSWLTTANGINELRGDALVAFARYFASAIVVHKNNGMSVSWVEMLDEPASLDGTFVSPDNYVVLVKSFKSILATRLNDANNNNIVDPVRVMGPGISCMIPKGQTVDPYIAALQGANDDLANPTLDAWSLHALENKIDSTYYNDGTIDARTYVRDRLKFTISVMNATLPGVPVYVTKVGSNATRFSQGIDYGLVAPESAEYAMRIVDNFCDIVAAGASMAISWFVTFRNDNKALYRVDGSPRPQREALLLLNRVFLPSGTIYLEQDTYVDDQTNKLFVVRGNSFGFVLSRAQLSDNLYGNVVMQIENPDWNANNLTTVINLYIFPSNSLVNRIDKNVTMEPGLMTITLRNVPYNCVVYGKGDVYV